MAKKKTREQRLAARRERLNRSQPIRVKTKVPSQSLPIFDILLAPGTRWLQAFVKPGFRSTMLSEPEVAKLREELGTDYKLYRVQRASGSSPYANTNTEKYVLPEPMNGEPGEWTQPRETGEMHRNGSGIVYHGWYISPTPHRHIVSDSKVFEVETSDTLGPLRWMGVQIDHNLALVRSDLPSLRTTWLEVTASQIRTLNVVTDQVWPYWYRQCVEPAFKRAGPIAIGFRFSRDDATPPPNGIQCSIVDSRLDAWRLLHNNHYQRRMMAAELIDLLLPTDRLRIALSICVDTMEIFARHQDVHTGGELIGDWVLMVLLEASDGLPVRQALADDIRNRWDCWCAGLPVYGSIDGQLILYRQP